MSHRYVIEALLRPAVEFNTTLVAATASYVCVAAPWAIALSPSVSYVTAIQPAANGGPALTPDWRRAWSIRRHPACGCAWQLH